jgi:hypothetical protein
MVISPKSFEFPKQLLHHQRQQYVFFFTFEFSQTSCTSSIGACFIKIFSENVAKKSSKVTLGKQSFEHKYLPLHHSS